MAKTWHEYDFPKDATTHWHELRPELATHAITVTQVAHVTCPGCLAWLDTQTKQRNTC